MTRVDRVARPELRPSEAGVWRASAVVAGWTLASRVAGFARDVLIAAVLGAGPIADAFLVALKLPNLFRRLFGEGAFSAAFVPALVRLSHEEGQTAGRRLAGGLAIVLALVLGAVVLGGELAMPWLMRLLAPGFVATPERLGLAVALTRITFPYVLLICLVALLGGVLNAGGRFAAAAATPVLFNLVCIAALGSAGGMVPGAAHALAIGVLAAGVVQVLWLSWWVWRAGWWPAWPGPLMSPGLRQVLRRLVPGLVGAGVTQLNVVIGIVTGSLLPGGTIAVLYYADRVAQLPLGAIGAALGTALLPALAADAARDDAQGAQARLGRAVGAAMALAVPAGVALVVLAGPITAVLFGRGAFDAAAAQRSAWGLRVYAAALPFGVLTRVLAPGFFARGDTVTPVRVGIACVAANVAVSLALLRPIGFLAPAAGLSFAAVLNACGLGWALRGSGGLMVNGMLGRWLVRVVGASALMGGAVFALARLAGPLLIVPGWVRAAALAGVIGAGFAVYAATLHALGGVDGRAWAGGLRRGAGRR